MTDTTNSPDPLPHDDDTAWPENSETKQRPENDERDSLVDKNVGVTGIPTPPD